MIFDLKIKHQIISIFKKINLSIQQSRHVEEEKKKEKKHECFVADTVVVLKKTSQPMTGWSPSALSLFLGRARDYLNLLY